VRDTFKLVIGILLLINLAACDALPGDKPPVDIPLTATADSPTAVTNQNWVVISKERAEEMRVASWLVEGVGYWTPSEDNILKLEEKIGEYLSQNPSQFYRQPPVWERLDEYQRQYIGLERTGRRL